MPDFSENESLLILKIHHCLADGVATMALTSTLTDTGYNVNNFPNLIPKLNPIQMVLFTILKYVTLPYSIIVA